MWVVQGRAQHYDWGDPHAIPALVGAPPDGRPWAEFWWGTHPAAPSTVDGRPLVDLTGPLPYLVKLLAAARPLSLQLHPDAAQAAAGFAREQALGIPLDDPSRTYRDPWPKPEMVIALTRFEAVCGLLPTSAVQRRWATLGGAAAGWEEVHRAGGPRAVMSWLLHERPDVTPMVHAARQVDQPWAHWMVTVAESFPGDPAVGALPLLRHVVLEPGDALFLGAGHLHAYLHGVGVEVMGPSDNVVRGGLTSKYVDTDAVVALMREDVLDDPVVRPERARHGDAHVSRYAVAEAPFVVESWEVDGTAQVTATGHEVWWCAHGDLGVVAQGRCGVTAADEVIELRGRGKAFRITTAARRPVPGPGDAPELRSDGSSPGGPTIRR